jgi:peptide/nickel transport system permease protein
MAVLLVILSAVLFGIMGLMPETKQQLLRELDPAITADDDARLRALSELDRPARERYVCWLFGRRLGGSCENWPTDKGVLGGDLGYSSVHQRPVAEVLGERLVRTLSITVPAFVIALLLAIGLGVKTAVDSGGLLDRGVSYVGFGAIALPLHWASMLAILILSVKLGLFPSSGVDTIGDEGFVSRVHHAMLPIAILTLYYAARWTRYLRASMLDVVRLDFIRGARARGLSERRVIWGHALPNAALPLITVVAQSIPGLFSGALVIERVFAYPGVGVLIWESVEGNDHLVAIVVFLIYALLTMMVSIVIDAALYAVDPRIRAGAPVDPLRSIEVPGGVS